MKTKESVKTKIDQLDKKELRVVEAVIDSIRTRQKKRKKTLDPAKPPYKKVIRHLGGSKIGSSDIIQERQDRV